MNGAIRKPVADARRCTLCNTPCVRYGRRRRCPSCDIYNAAVAAQGAAAKAIAAARYPQAKDAFLNEYGVLAWVDGVCDFVGTAEEAAPFVALTSAARRVHK